MGVNILTNEDLVKAVRDSSTFRFRQTSYGQGVLEAMLKVDRKKFLPSLLLPREGYEDRVKEEMLSIIRQQALDCTGPLEISNVLEQALSVNKDFCDSVLDYAYEDDCLPITYGVVGNGPQSTCSQPSLVAKMTERIAENLADIRNPSILELGSGCGYHLAIVKQALPKAEVYGMEIDPNLVDLARVNLTRQFGTRGWHIQQGNSRSLEHLPTFDAIYITFGLQFPFDTGYLHNKLNPKGILIYPQAEGSLFLDRKDADSEEVLLNGVSFVAMQ